MNALSSTIVPQPQQRLQPFSGHFRCRPVAFAGKDALENGDKIILPQSALRTLTQLQVQYPMSFRLTNVRNNKSTHVGVMEFSAEEGVAYVPFWIMEKLGVETDGLVNILNIAVQKGTFVKFQPHATAFTQLTNPRAVLERALRFYSCFTQGDYIVVPHGDERFVLDVVETKPGSVISVIETDLNVDFAPPKDAPPEEETAAVSRPTASASASVADLDGLTPEERKFIMDGIDPGFAPGMFSAAAPAPATAAAAGPDSSSTAAASAAAAAFATPAKFGGSGYRLSRKRTAEPTADGKSQQDEPAGKKPAADSPAALVRATTCPLPGVPGVAAPPTPSTTKQVSPCGRWEYIYSVPSKPGEKPRLLRRVSRAESKPFAGGGYSLKG